LILRFGVENFLSFHKYVQVDLTAMSCTDEPSLVHPFGGARHGVLPVMAVYGANASGKSNLVEAFVFLRSAVVHSQTEWKPGARIPRTAFHLDEAARSAPSRFDCDLVVDGVRYHFGFVCDDERFLEEWLYAWPSGRRQVWYHRTIDDEPWYFGPNFPEAPRARRQIVASVRPNSLFISAAAQQNHDAIGRIYAMLAVGVVQPPMRDVEGGITLFDQGSPLFDEENRSALTRLLRAADIGVTDFRVVDRAAMITDVADRLDADGGAGGKMLRDALSRFGPPQELQLGHRTRSGEIVYFDSRLESYGTMMLLSRLNGVFAAISAGGLLVADEIDRSLHPRLCAAIISLFTDPRSNTRGAQLLLTAHDQSLTQHLRRDEIVFVDKGTDGASLLTPLSDFKTRKRDDIRRGLSDGRFGGVPTLADLPSALMPHGR